MKTIAGWFAVLFLTTLFCPMARGELVALLQHERLKVFNEEGHLVYSAKRVVDYQESFALVGFTKKDKTGRESFNLIDAEGSLLYKSYDVERYYIEDEIVAVQEFSGKLVVIDAHGAIRYSDKRGFDQIQLSDDYLAYLEGNRLKVVLNTGQVTLSIKNVVQFRLKETLLVISDDESVMIATKTGKIRVRQSLK